MEKRSDMRAVLCVLLLASSVAFASPQVHLATWNLMSATEQAGRNETYSNGGLVKALHNPPRRLAYKQSASGAHTKPLLDPNGIVVKGPLHLLSPEDAQVRFGDGSTPETTHVVVQLQQYPTDEVERLWLAAVKEPKTYWFAARNPEIGDSISTGDYDKLFAMMVCLPHRVELGKTSDEATAYIYRCVSNTNISKKPESLTNQMSVLFLVMPNSRIARYLDTHADAIYAAFE